MSSRGSCSPHRPAKTDAVRRTRASRQLHRPCVGFGGNLSRRSCESVFLRAHLDFRSHEVILLVLRRVRAQDELLHRIVLSRRFDSLRQPLHRQARPFECMRDHQIVQERGVLLPDLVLFVHQAGFHFVWIVVLRCAHGDRTCDARACTFVRGNSRANSSRGGGPIATPIPWNDHPCTRRGGSLSKPYRSSSGCDLRRSERVRVDEKGANAAFRTRVASGLSDQSSLSQFLDRPSVLIEKRHPVGKAPDPFPTVPDLFPIDPKVERKDQTAETEGRTR